MNDQSSQSLDMVGVTGSIPVAPTSSGQRVASKREHAPFPDCWCNPTLYYVDADTGNSVWVHHEPN
jgi:hypothetical protein